MFKQLLTISILAGTFLGQSVLAGEKDGPFGIYMGMPIDELDIEFGDLEVKSLSSVPSPHPLLGGYGAAANSRCGVSRVVATTESEDRAKLEDTFELLLSELVEKYGAPTGTNEEDKPFKQVIIERMFEDGGPKTYDAFLLKPGNMDRESVLSSPAMKAFEGTRMYFHNVLWEWGVANTPNDNLSAIELYIRTTIAADGTDEGGVIALWYIFANFFDCSDAAKRFR